MKPYPKIDTLFKRDSKFKVIVDDWRRPEFEYLKANEWRFFEKIHGINIRVQWHPAAQVVEFKGRNKNTQPIPFVWDMLAEKFPRTLFLSKYPDMPMTIYGEGFGSRVQKGGGNYKSDGVDFACFDIWIDGWWLKWDDVKDICANLHIDTVPYLHRGNLEFVTNMARAGYNSTFGDFKAEGIVVKPVVQLFNRKGERVIGKIKYSDFAKG